MYPTKGQRPSFQTHRHISLLAALDDGDEGGEEGEGGDDEGEGSGGADSNDDGEGSTDSDKVRDPEKKKLSDEAAKYRKQLRDSEAARLKLEEAEKERKRSGMDELTKANDMLAEAQKTIVTRDEELAARDSQIQELQLRLALATSGISALFLDEKVMARVFLPEVEFEPNEDGSYDTESIRKETEAWLKKNPSYRKADADGSSGKKEGGSPSNRRKTDGKDTSTLKKKFPALAAR